MKNNFEYLYLNLTDIEDVVSIENEDINSLLNIANKELKKYYSGKYKFEISNENKKVDKLKLNPKKNREIKEL